MVQRLALGDRPAQQRGKRQQLRQRLALAMLAVELEHVCRPLVDILQVAVVIPSHDAVFHAFQQAIQLVQVAVGFSQQAVGIERVTDTAGDRQRQGKIARGPLLQQAPQRDGAALPPAVVINRCGAK